MRGRTRRWRLGIGILPILLGAFLLPIGSAQAAMPPIKHVFVLIDENESEATSFGPSSPAPYLSQTLVAQGAFLPDYYGIGHSSLDNYIAMVSGQAPNPDTSGDCPVFADFPSPSLTASGQENGEGCVYPTDVPTLMGQLGAAKLTWRAYEDGMGADPAREAATCGHPPVGAPDNTEVATATDQYATRHDPFVYFHSVIDNAAECNADVVNLDQLPNDLRSVATTPNYVFITPNLCDDGHDATCANGGPGGLAQADAFLRTWVPQITSSPAFKENGLLIVTFDEAVGDSSACCGEQPGPYDAANGIQPGGNGPGGGAVGAVLLSPFIKPGTRSTTPYNHYSMLASIEDIFGLSRIGFASGVASFGADVFTNPPPSRGHISALLHRAVTAMTHDLHAKRLVARHRFQVVFPAPEGGVLLVQWYSLPGHHLLASGTLTFASASTHAVTVKLTRAGRRLLAAGKRFGYTAQFAFTPADGEAAVVVKRRLAFSF